MQDIKLDLMGSLSEGVLTSVIKWPSWTNAKLSLLPMETFLDIQTGYSKREKVPNHIHLAI
jgi:hypothetical protein